MSRSAPIAAAVFAAFAAWLSQGTIGFGAPDGPRLAVLPLSGTAWLIAIVAALSVMVLRRQGASLLPVLLLGLVVLPWLPIPMPAAFLLWVKPLCVVIWLAVLALMTASLPVRVVGSDLRRPRMAAALIAAIVFGVSAWRVAPMIPGGDEPHYLVITQSLLLDRDLTIEDVHRRGDYRAYFAGDLPPHVQRLGRDGQIYSVHAPGLPVLIAPAFAIGGYRAVVVFLVLVASAGSALAWHIGWLTTRRVDAAWFSWAAVTLPVTAIFQSFTVYPDGPGGVIALTGLWALLRAAEEAKSGATAVKPWFLHGIALAALPWLHSRFAVLAGGFGALILLRLSTTKNPAAKAVAFLSVPAVSALLWVGFFIAIYGSPDPSAAYGPGELGSLQFVPGGLGGLLFDQRFGLLTYAPVLGVAFVGVGVMLARPAWRRVGLELLFVVIPYLVTVTHFAMWWGGRSPPARFFAPVLPLFVAPAAALWPSITGRASRLVAVAALVLTAIASTVVVGIDRGRLAFNTREGPALWLEWLGRVTELSAAAPRWARETDAPLFRAIAVWVVILAGTWAILRAADASRRLRQRAAFQTLSIAAFAIAAMAATSIVWAFEGASGLATVPSQLQLLEALAARPPALALQLGPLSRVVPTNVPGRLRMEVSRRPPAGRGGGASPLFTIPSLPAGEYRIRIEANAPRGWVMIGIARDPRDPFALRTLQLPAEAIDLRLPLPVRALVVRGDEEASRVVQRLVVEPLGISRPDERLTSEMARRAVRYGESTVYFLDDRSFPEPEAFWVGGARGTTVLIQPDVNRPTVTLRLRNAPVENKVTLTSGAWRHVLQMVPGEEQEVEMPLDAARGGGMLQVESASGFRPAEHDPASRDQRYLGVWVKVLGSRVEP